jgi:hypothetical protein
MSATWRSGRSDGGAVVVAAVVVSADPVTVNTPHISRSTSSRVEL